MDVGDEVCCICGEEESSGTNLIVFCEGKHCKVAVHQDCYGIPKVPKGPWFCSPCLLDKKGLAQIICELCPNGNDGGALKRTDKGEWAHVVCGLFIPQVGFGSRRTMEPMLTSHIPRGLRHLTCIICLKKGGSGIGKKELRSGRASRSDVFMKCHQQNCQLYFHATCAQYLGLLCEEKLTGKKKVITNFCGFCEEHASHLKLEEQRNIKFFPPCNPGQLGTEAGLGVGTTTTAAVGDSKQMELSSAGSSSQTANTRAMAAPEIPGTSSSGFDQTPVTCALAKATQVGLGKEHGLGMSSQIESGEPEPSTSACCGSKPPAAATGGKPEKKRGRPPKDLQSGTKDPVPRLFLGGGTGGISSQEPSPSVIGISHAHPTVNCSRAERMLGTLSQQIERIATEASVPNPTIEHLLLDQLAQAGQFDIIDSISTLSAVKVENEALEREVDKLTQRRNAIAEFYESLGGESLRKHHHPRCSGRSSGQGTSTKSNST